MKTIATLQNESDKLADIAEKSAVKFVYSYLYKLNKHYSKIAQQGSELASLHRKEVWLEAPQEAVGVVPRGSSRRRRGMQ